MCLCMPSIDVYSTYNVLRCIIELFVFILRSLPLSLNAKSFKIVAWAVGNAFAIPTVYLHVWLLICQSFVTRTASFVAAILNSFVQN